VADGTPMEEPALATLEALPAAPVRTVVRRTEPSPLDLFTVVTVDQPARTGRQAPATTVQTQQWAMAL
jgi:hypothetical protein